MAAIAGGQLSDTEPGYLFTPASGAATSKAAVADLKALATGGLDAVCPYVNSAAASEYAQAFITTHGGPTMTASSQAKLLHGTSAVASETGAVDSQTCHGTSCTGLATFTPVLPIGGTKSTEMEFGTTEIGTKWYVTTLHYVEDKSSTT
jgi:hypothetical protein